MSVSTITNRVQFSPNGSTTNFVFPYYFFLASDLVIILTTAGIDSAPLILGVDYTVSTIGSSPFISGGTVIMTVAPIVTTILTIKRIIPLTQLIHYANNDSFPSATNEQVLDRLTLIIQQLAEMLLRVPILPDSDNTTTKIPNITTRANMRLGFDGSGNITILP